MRALLVGELSIIDANWLPCQNIQVDLAGTGKHALNQVRRHDFDIVILNLVIPDMDGCELLVHMRDSGTRVPVLVISNVPRSEVHARALSLGADGLLITPVDPAELLARIHAILRRANFFSPRALTAGSLCLDLDAREVTAHGQLLALSSSEYAILELLMMRKGIAVSKEMLMNHLYGGIDQPEMKIIDVFVCRLRRKLADAGCDNVVRTIWGHGYILREPSKLLPMPQQTNDVGLGLHPSAA